MCAQELTKISLKSNDWQSSWYRNGRPRPTTFPQSPDHVPNLSRDANNDSSKVSSQSNGWITSVHITYRQILILIHISAHYEKRCNRIWFIWFKQDSHTMIAQITARTEDITFICLICLINQFFSSVQLKIHQEDNHYGVIFIIITNIIYGSIYSRNSHHRR